MWSLTSIAEYTNIEHRLYNIFLETFIYFFLRFWKICCDSVNVLMAADVTSDDFPYS